MAHTLFELLHSGRMLHQLVSRITTRRAELGPDAVFSIPLHPQELIEVQVALTHAARAASDGKTRLGFANQDRLSALAIALRGLAIMSGEFQIVLEVGLGAIAIGARPMVHQAKCDGGDCSYNSGSAGRVASKLKKVDGRWICCRAFKPTSGVVTYGSLSGSLEQQSSSLGLPAGPGMIFVQADDGELYSAVRVPPPPSPPGDDQPLP